MEENFKEILTKLIKEENERENSQKEVIAQIEREKELLKIKEETEIDRFTEGMKQDIESGLYNNKTEGYMQKIINESKNTIIERYNTERERLSINLEKVKNETEKNKEKIYKEINSEIKKYHVDMVLEITKATRELSKMKSEREDALKDIEQKIAELEAKRTNMIIRNRKFMNIEGNQISVDINALGIEIEQLKSERDNLSSGFDEKIEIQSQYVQQCIEKKERAAKVIGGKILSDKSLEEIYQMLFDNEELASEEVIEEKILNEDSIIEEEKTEEEKTEDEKKEDEIVDEQEEPIQNVTEETNQGVEKKSPVINKTHLMSNNANNLEEDVNYKYYQNNKDSIINYFMIATGVKKNEVDEIFKDIEHCKEIGEICRGAMKEPKKSKDEIFELMENYYWGIHSRIDIKVSYKGIQYNSELINPVDIAVLEEEEQEFVDKVIEKFENQLSSYTSNPSQFVFDKNIITAIAIDNCKENENEKLQLTPSGMKKIGEYLELIVNPLSKNGTVAYNLEKMSRLRGFVNLLAWSPKKVGEFREIAYKVKDTYAQVIPDRITKIGWEIKDWFKGLTTKKLTAGEVSDQKEVIENNEKKNKWELPFEQKVFANSRNKNSSNISSKKIEKDEMEIL